MPVASDVKVFVPAKDFQASLDYYQKLGWKLNWLHEHSLAELELGNDRFLLQNYFEKEWAHNFMLFIEVPNALDWYSHIEHIITADKRFKACRVEAPKNERHALVCYAWDPSGVLLHFAQLNPSV